jgi:hypothetical protein
MTFAISIDRHNGGFYHMLGHRMARLCLGYLSFDLFYDSIDSILIKALHTKS